MNIHLRRLIVRTRQTTEELVFSEAVTFLHGPVGTGKSSVARLIDYCFGGELERTPAIQQEFISVELALVLGQSDCTIERAAEDTQSVRVTWSGPDGFIGSVNAPLRAQESPLVNAEVFNLSDLIFHLCGETPIKVRQRSRDPESPLIRLSIRDIWSYCYLDQTHLDSSFFRLEDPFRGRKSQDAMRFFTGLHSERLSQLEGSLFEALDEQRSKREAVQQIRTFMNQFGLGSEVDLSIQLQTVELSLAVEQAKMIELETTRTAQIHPVDTLRDSLRTLSTEIGIRHQALLESKESIAEQVALHAELITAKTKVDRTNQAASVLEGAHYQHCPECGANLEERENTHDHCRLCTNPQHNHSNETSVELEVLRRDLNERIDQIADSIERRDSELARMVRQLSQLEKRKAEMDLQLQGELARYDSAFVESIRKVEREIATLTERLRSLAQLQRMPQAITDYEEQAGALQGGIDVLRSSLDEERSRLRTADAHIAEIAEEFKRVMQAVGFPGLADSDDVILDPRNWRPMVVHGEQSWSFWDTGSGGKKTLFNVCYAIALHAVALRYGMPVPSLLIVDSPTKNISDDENPELVHALYTELYRLVGLPEEHRLQLLLIDSNLIEPEIELPGFTERRMAGTPEAPSLISYYVGP